VQKFTKTPDFPALFRKTATCSKLAICGLQAAFSYADAKIFIRHNQQSFTLNFYIGSSTI